MARKRKNQKSAQDVIRLISKDGHERDFKKEHAERLLRYPDGSWKVKQEEQEANLIQEDASQTD